jgi:nodulation protein E
MRLALGDAGLAPQDVTYVNAHGTGTLANDREESAAIREVFGEGRPDFRISSTKSMIGHAMGASGALEAVATVLALQRQVAPPTAGHRVVDPACGLDVTPGAAVAHEMRHAVSNSFAFGGLNASLVLGAA